MLQNIHNNDNYHQTTINSPNHHNSNQRFEQQQQINLNDDVNANDDKENQVPHYQHNNKYTYKPPADSHIANQLLHNHTIQNHHQCHIDRCMIKTIDYHVTEPLTNSLAFRYDDSANDKLLKQSIIFPSGSHKKRRRRRKYRYERINWDQHIHELLYRKKFRRHYHMSYGCFESLRQLLQQQQLLVTVPPIGGDPEITIDMIIGSSLRYLGGEEAKTIGQIYKISEQSILRIINKFLDACLKETTKLPINLPDVNDYEQMDDLSNGFASLAEHSSILDGCVGAIDGWLCTINKPRGVTNQADYYSGHYCVYGLNVQAICDSRYRFLYVGVNSPGKTNDNLAIRRCTDLQQWLDQLETTNKYFLVGDNAYTLSPTILIPYSGSQRSDPDKRTFNFKLSQNRIRIEMAFGQLNSRFRIFQSNMNENLETVTKVIQVAARLHNYTINYDNHYHQKVLPISTKFGKIRQGYLSATISNDNLETQSSNTQHNAGHIRRNRILNVIKEKMIERPYDNIRRNDYIEDVSDIEDDSEDEKL